jgi:hypothetical protein
LAQNHFQNRPKLQNLRNLPKSNFSEEISFLTDNCLTHIGKEPELFLTPDIESVLKVESDPTFNELENCQKNFLPKIKESISFEN